MASEIKNPPNQDNMKYIIIYKEWEADQFDRRGFPTGHRSDGNKMKEFDTLEEGQAWELEQTSLQDGDYEFEKVWSGWVLQDE